MKHWNERRRVRKLRDRLATNTNHMRLMGNRKWAILVIGHVVVRLSEPEIARMVEICAQEMVTEQDVMGDVYE